MTTFTYFAVHLLKGSWNIQADNLAPSTLDAIIELEAIT